MLQGVAVHRVARQMPRIGFIVASTPSLRAACLQNWGSKAGIIRIKNADDRVFHLVRKIGVCGVLVPVETL